MVILPNMRRIKLRHLWTLICFITAIFASTHLYYFSICGRTNETESLDNSITICLVGNAQTKKHALNMHQMWNGAFDSYWFIWNDDFKNEYESQNNIVFLYSHHNLTWTKGIEFVVNHIEQIGKSYDYIFTHDDDLSFRIKEQFNSQKMSLSDVLIEILSKYRPAIASFPWTVGDNKIAQMRELAALYRNKTIAPLTGFDNGMVLYHRSIVNFFIPFSPHGEGGFTGDWTLCAHFLQMFAYLLFEKYAVRLNIFEYNNTINIDNIVLHKNLSSLIRIKDGLAYVRDSRHPYEYPQNQAYIAFLSSGLKSPYTAWGRALARQHRLQTPEPTGMKRNSFDGMWLLNRLNIVYDIRHEALSNNKFLHTQISNAQKLSILRNTNFRLKLILLTMNRPSSFGRLWKSLGRAIPINRTINIFIHVDMDYSDKNHQAYLDYLNSLRSIHGDIHVNFYSVRRGLKTIMMEAWHPLNNDEYAVFIEDDVELSPFFLLYIDKLVKAYFYDSKLDHRLFGISLYNQRYNDVIEKYVNIPNNHQLYIYQMPQSWGALYAPKMWRKFVEFLGSKIDPYIPDSYTNRWPQKTSWKKYLLRFMYQEQGCLIYPNFPWNLSLSTNHLEYGLHDKVSNNTDVAQLQKKLTVPLLYNKKIFEQLKTPPFDKLHIYNIQHKRVDCLDDLKVPLNKMISFDTCTMILTVYDRTNTTWDRLVYYQNFTYLSSIVVIWNNVNVTPISDKQLRKLKIPVHMLRMNKNSLNNRFYPYRQIQTDCIINMDDDWDMPYAHMAFAIDTWRGHFFNNLVGFSHLGRNHVPVYVNGTLKYEYSTRIFSKTKRPYYSIVLPSGFVYHRRYLYQYTYKLPQRARDIVDDFMNCDDILFNFLVANITKQGPVVIEADAKPYKVPGLWKRSNHIEIRSLCLNKFVEIFDRMPLKYTTSIFKIDTNHTVPSKSRHLFQIDMPTTGH